ncbi:RICIN domain-containing protein [Crossiella sp. SN42]|uniref:RICIN domain-containing protein n=1 Tax=Crossiella sp. SN42 TaxID=2944808 RepID=UPI00207CD696|nr:RICIN domain-containing protein [Crossiella sp. SN42]MCO1574578.1 RICIN domain-containing protein [Crossiella sp. SN42]
MPLSAVTMSAAVALALLTAPTSVAFTSDASTTAAHPPTRGTKAPPWLRNVNSGQCIAIPNGSPADGLGAIQYPCDQAGTDKYWFFDPAPDGYTMLRNELTNKCLAIAQGNPADGVPVIQFECHEEWTDQHWKSNAVSEDTFEMRNRVTGKCVTVRDGSVGDGAPVVQQGCLGQTYQHWFQ